MPMKPEDRQKIVETIKEKVAAAKANGAGPRGCPICGTDLWDVGNDFVSIGTANVVGVLTEGKYLPSVVLICTNCGNEQFMNLIGLGLAGLGTTDRTAPLVVVPTTLRPPNLPPPPSALITMEDLKPVKGPKSG